MKLGETDEPSNCPLYHVVWPNFVSSLWSPGLIPGWPCYFLSLALVP
jgi:hypothetical protein